jgi:hypothetical protein
MKKIIKTGVVMSFIVASASCFAAAVTLAGGTAGTTVTDTTCPALAASTSVKIVLSTSNIGAYDCTATGAAIGVAVGNTAGKGVTYSTGSGGGAITPTTETVDDTNLKARATAKMNAANSS